MVGLADASAATDSATATDASATTDSATATDPTDPATAADTPITLFQTDMSFSADGANSDEMNGCGHEVLLQDGQPK